MKIDPIYTPDLCWVNPLVWVFTLSRLEPLV